MSESIDFKVCRESRVPGNIITPKGRLSYPNLLKAMGSLQNPENKKFSCSILIPPGSDLTLLKEAASKAALEKWGAKIPAKLKTPFLDAGEFGDKAGYEPGWILIRANSEQKPGVALADGSRTEEQSEIYGGRWGVLSLRAFAYDVSGNKGVSFGLQNVQLFEHDEPFGSRRVSAEEEFAEVTTTQKTAKAVESLF